MAGAYSKSFLAQCAEFWRGCVDDSESQRGPNLTGDPGVHATQDGTIEIREPVPIPVFAEWRRPELLEFLVAATIHYEARTYNRSKGAKV